MDYMNENKLVPFELYAATLNTAQRRVDELRPNAKWRAVLLLDTMSGASMVVAEYLQTTDETTTKFQKAVIPAEITEVLMSEVLNRTMTTQDLVDLVDNAAAKFVEEQYAYENK
jgi:hypothetical protein